MSTYHQGLGAEEHVQALYVRTHQATPLYHRYRTPYGEIDLILETPEVIYFVEVKMRRSRTQAAHSLRPAQRKRLAEAILHFSAEHPKQNHKVFQFDVALVVPNTHIEIVENVILSDEMGVL